MVQTEENRVSYGRRNLQARLDAAAGFGKPRVAPSRLAPVVAEQQTASRRLAALTVHDATATPPLPDLAVLWDSTAEDADSALLTRLADAEAELSAYRHALHSRLDDATDELIARYREEPTLALTALPGPRRG